MSYPLAKMPTLRQFVAKACSLGCTEHTSKSGMVGPRGKVKYRYLKNNKGAFVILQDIHDDVRLTPIVLSNYIRRLGLDPSAFGFPIGLLKDPTT